MSILHLVSLISSGQNALSVQNVCLAGSEKIWASLGRNVPLDLTGV